MLLRYLRDLRHIGSLVTDPELSRSYYPGERRKSRGRMFADLVAWRTFRGEVNRYYFAWGMDRVHGPRSRDVLSYRQFMRLRDRRNQHGHSEGLNYIALMRDKYLFDLLLRALDFPTPPLVALVDPRGVEWLHPHRAAPLSSLLEAGDVDLFCKPRYGIQGRGVFRLQVRDGTLLADGAPVTLESLASMLGQNVLQRPIVQHPVLASLHPSSVNTLRLITVRDRSGTRPFSQPMLRIGFGGSVVDNGTAGGIQVFADPDTGRLRGPGIMLRGGTVSHHPDTGIAIDGFEIPCYAEAVELAVRLHRAMPALHTIGWDLAITPDGPVFIEGNDNWAAGLRIGLEPGFKQAFTQLCRTR